MKEAIKDYSGKILGFLETDNAGNKVLLKSDAGFLRTNGCEGRLYYDVIKIKEETLWHLEIC
ncbi:MAG: hypothetical protein IJA74_02930 [Oscillospiraceae bacterium]|nr:hypothetical protein [Oscillospiraceae bacterium]